MILFKYVDIDTAHLIIKNGTLKFSKASSFNDPFELTSLHYGENPYIEEQIMRRIVASMSYGILSLTRNPLNPLMWAHYAKGKYAEFKGAIRLDANNNSHAGIVFGIDVEEAGFNTPGINVVPAKYGSVIYTTTKPNHPFENSENQRIYEGLLFNFEPTLLEALQRTFLYKSFHWSYEEEVRVVRNVSRGHIRNEIQQINTSSIKEIYIGIRNGYNKSYLLKFREEISDTLPDCKIFVCRMDNHDWSFNKVSIDEAIKTLDNQD